VIQVPTLATLRKYGFDETTWRAFLDEQDGVCGACGKVPSTNRLVIDHEHVRGWKQMAPALRSQFVRGLLCWSCNHYRLARGATVDNLRGAAAYLERYQARRAA
jgi:hypothetical protein